MKSSPCGFHLSHKHSLVPRYSETLTTNQINLNTTRVAKIKSAFKSLVQQDRMKLPGDGIAIGTTITWGFIITIIICICKLKRWFSLRISSARSSWRIRYSSWRIRSLSSLSFQVYKKIIFFFWRTSRNGFSDHSNAFTCYKWIFLWI